MTSFTIRSVCRVPLDVPCETVRIVMLLSQHRALDILRAVWPHLWMAYRSVSAGVCSVAARLFDGRVRNRRHAVHRSPRWWRKHDDFFLLVLLAARVDEPGAGQIGCVAFLQHGMNLVDLIFQSLSSLSEIRRC